MSVNLIEFPLELSGMESIVCFNTTIVEPGTSNGFERRNANWQDPLYKYNLKHCVKSKADANTLQTFFIICKGQRTAFLVKDRLDFKLDEDISDFPDNTPDGTKTEFQLFKVYQVTEGELIFFYRRDITKPKTGTVVVRINGAVVPTLDYSVDAATGKITFNSAPEEGDVINVQCEFRVPIRFTIDELPANLDEYWIDDNGNEIAHVYFPDIPAREVRNE